MNGFLDSRKRKLQLLPAGCKRKLQLLPPGMRTVPVLTEQRLEPSLTLRNVQRSRPKSSRGRGRLGIDRRHVDIPLRRDLLPRSGLKILA